MQALHADEPPRRRPPSERPSSPPGPHSCENESARASSTSARPAPVGEGAVVGARFEQANRSVGVLAESRCDDAAGRSAADHDDVEAHVPEHTTAGVRSRSVDPLDVFSPQTRDWFTARVSRADGRAGAGLAGDRARRTRPHPGADRARERRSRRSSTASTGSTRAPGEGLRLLYVSPLKALNYDVERNLRSPLAGLRSRARGRRPHGDTPADERRRMLRRRRTS